MATASTPQNITKIQRYLELAPGVKVPSAAWTPMAQEVLTAEVISLLADLHRELNGRRLELLRERKLRQLEYDQGDLPSYEDRKSEAATGDWKVAEIPTDLLKRRVEITGPVNSAKMVINMLSRGADGQRADCAMLDFEDSLKPSWANVISGVHNVIGAVDGTLSFLQEAKGEKKEKLYALDPEDMAIVMVRCRGLHLNETNFLVDGQPISAGIFDLGLCFYHTVQKYLDRGKTPKYYVPKVEHYLEARWWNDLFSALEREMEVPLSTLRATFLIETLPAAFQMEEILYELKDHAVGLNGGRWDKIFSDIKTLKHHEDRVMADRGYISMQCSWMLNYAKRLIEVCHRRGAFAMGGMAAFTPGRDPALREQQVAKVKEDKEFESNLGHDGCWVSHPYFIKTAMEQFKQDNQLERLTDLEDKYPDLLPKPEGPKTEAGLRKNVRVGIAYLHGWQNDIGCVAWDNLMEDLATLEISRAQVWQWIHHGVRLDNGILVNKEFVQRIFEEEFEKIILGLDPERESPLHWRRARRAAEELFLREEFPEFLCFSSEEAR